MPKYGQYGHILVKMAILIISGHRFYDQKYDHDGYPWKVHTKTKSAMKELINFEILVIIYGQNMDFDFLKK